MSKAHVVGEQEACLRYEASKGEGDPARDWLRRACKGLGEMEAQVASLQAKHSQTLGQSSVRMIPS